MVTVNDCNVSFKEKYFIFYKEYKLHLFKSVNELEYHVTFANCSQNQK